ncbi:RK kinase, partial [Urocolius indicus]|nr:RK kinase [Urocolius indicus]
EDEDDEERSFAWQCVEQPIGQRLFRRFLARTPALAAAAALWDELDGFGRCDDGDREPTARSLRQRFMDPGGPQYCGFLSAEAKGQAGG